MTFYDYQDNQDEMEDYSQLDHLCNEVLTIIEMSELRLLNWGFVDVRSQLEVSEISEILETKLTEHGRSLWEEAQLHNVTPEKIRQNLLDRCLIFETPLKGNSFYRSRFAETIRLLAYLRQRFSHSDWQTALRLVSDFKIDLKRRSYPRRDISYNDVCDELQQSGAKPAYIQAIQCLLRKDTNSYIKLACFQKDAILKQYRIIHPAKDITDRRDHAIVIGAGTSSGKTKAYYIPTMAEIATSMTMVRFVRAMAIYPRTELLKDQLIEAFLEARKLDDFLHKLRPITIGAYYGDIPEGAITFVKNWRTSWEKASEKRRVDGWECPFFRCPDEKCKQNPQPLIWYKEDIEQEYEQNKSNIYGEYAQLRCPECSFKVTEQQLLLTREQLRRTPPDILFITAEMLNRCMSRANEHHLIGIDLSSDKPQPRMLLLDEIHTYEGLSGSHVAYLLRRWRHARRLRYHEPLCCVGLSATLNNAESFFAKLTDISINHISYVHPEQEDMEEEGAEYNVVLKGDPVSATNLLSTSVQTVMLLARMLDKSRDVPSHGTYGEKVFAFTDKLDVISRWYYIEYDAEVRQTLSQFRMPDRNDSREVREKKLQAGQYWKFSQDIPHELRQPLRIGLTSSRQRGVDSQARLIIATSALEVGFNDKSVGAVVQHKAPYSLASFLQRKGRAGRERGMRPWMVTVTSEYGRDRWTFQHAEHLFYPELNDIHLPIDNYYVRKVQATLAFMDWLSLEMKASGNRFVEVWKVLSCPDEKNRDKLQNERQEVIKIVKEIIEGDARFDQLKRYLQFALGLRTRQEVESLLWDEPRSLMFAVFPTLLRDLGSDWQRISYEQEKWTIQKWQEWRRDPLPDFITPNLFSDLYSINIPIKLPKPLSAGTKKLRGQELHEAEESDIQKRYEESLPLLLCMKEFAPGNINKRFVRHKVISQSGKLTNEAHWLALPQGDWLKRGVLPIDKLKIIYDGVITEWTIDNEKYYLCQPRAYELEDMPPNMKDSSSAFLQWKSHFIGKSSLQAVDPTVTKGKPLTLARGSSWRHFFTDISSYTQDAGCYTEVARLATSVQADLRYTGLGKTERLWLQFKKGNDNAGIGFVHRVDALQLRFEPLDVNQLLQSPNWSNLYVHLRPEYFRDRLEHHQAILNERLSRFEIEWLWQIELSMIIATAVAQNQTLQEAAKLVHDQRSSLARYTMQIIFQSQQINAGKQEKLEVDIDPEEQEKTGRLQEKLQDFFDNRDLQSALEECESVLWNLPDQEFYNWLQQCYASSLGHALFAALAHMLTDINSDDLVMDIEGNSIWISEATPGGIGVISRLVRNLERQPYEFDLQMQQILRHCSREEIATQLQMVAELMQQGNQELKDAFQQVRQAIDLPQQEVAREKLNMSLEEHGVAATRGLVVALQTKFLQANTDIDTDELVVRLTDLWRSEEQRLECAIDLRVIAVAATRREGIKEQLTRVFKRIGDDPGVPNPQIFNALQSLLWLPCVNSCPDCIEEFQPYQNFAKPSRRLLQLLLPSNMGTVAYGQTEWRERIVDELSNRYSVLLRCEQSQLPQYKEHLQELLLEKIEIGSQYFYPTIESVTREGRIWTTELRIWEFTHG